MAGLSGKAVALGNPQSSTHQISQPQLADWMTEIESLIGLSGFAFVRGSAAALAGLGADGDYALVVSTGTDRGIYQRAAGTWSKVADLPLIMTESLAASQAEASAASAATSANNAASSAIGAGNSAATAVAAAAAAANSQSLADVARTQAQLAAVAAGATIYASVASGEAATVNGDVFLVSTEPGVQVYENSAGTGAFLGWLGEVLLDDDTAVNAWSASSPQVGLILRTRTEGHAYEVVSHPSDRRTAGGANLKKILTTGDKSAGFGPLTGVEYVPRTASATDPNLITSFGGKVYGYFNGTLYEKASEAGSWAVTTALPDTQEIRHLVPMADGQVVLVNSTQIYKSSGWGTGSVTWSLKVMNSGASAVFLEYSAAGSEGQSKMIVGEYAGGSAGAGWEASKRAWATQDSGANWSVVYDAETLYPADFDDSHLHGCCYDPWQDLFFVIEGHTAQRGIRYSADPFTDATNWTRIEKGPLGEVRSDGQPTNIVPTGQGIVLASDGPEQGFWVINRGDVPSDMTIQWVWEWPVGRGGIIGFGRCHARDPNTGVVYFGFQHNHAPNAVNPLALFACDGAQAAQVWRGGFSDIPTTGNVNTVVKIVVTPWGAIEAQTSASSQVGLRSISGYVTRGAGMNYIQDTGGVLGGLREPPLASSRCTALGAGSYINKSGVVAGAASTVVGDFGAVLGVSSHVLHENGTVVGSFSQTGGLQCTVVGYNLRTGDNGIAIGALRNLEAYQNAVSIGATQTITGDSVVAIGHNVTCSVSGAAVGGTLSEVTQVQGTVWGHNSQANHIGATVLGYTLQSTAPHQVQLGEKHIELQTAIGAPANGAAGTARIFTRVNGGGKQEFCVRFPTGDVIILATEA